MTFHQRSTGEEVAKAYISRSRGGTYQVNTPQPWHAAISDLGIGWKKIHGLPEISLSKTKYYEELIGPLFKSPQEIEELPMFDPGLDYFKSQFPRSHSLQVFISDFVEEEEEEVHEAETAHSIFESHIRAMQSQGLVSQLKYVGINDKVYTYIPESLRSSPTSTKLEDGETGACVDNFVLEIESEQAETFPLLRKVAKK